MTRTTNVDAADTCSVERAHATVQVVERRCTVVQTASPGGGMVWRLWGQAGRKIVFLHGGSGSWTHWIHTIPSFERRCQLLVADLPGLGDSPTPCEPCSTQSVAEIVCAGIDELSPGDEPLDLVTFSFGGTIGAHVARLRPSRICSLTVVGTPPFGISPRSPANELSRVDKELTFEEARGAHRQNLERLMLKSQGSVDELALYIHHENLRRARLKSRRLVRDDTFKVAVRQVSCPLHGIWGEHDTTIYPSIDAIRKLFHAVDSRASFDVLPNAGHWAAYEAPEKFNCALADRLGLEDKQ